MRRVGGDDGTVVVGGGVNVDYGMLSWRVCQIHVFDKHRLLDKIIIKTP